MRTSWVNPMADTLIVRLIDLFENLEADVKNLKQRVKILLERLRCTAISRYAPKTGNNSRGQPPQDRMPELALCLLWGRVTNQHLRMLDLGSSKVSSLCHPKSCLQRVPAL